MTMYRKSILFVLLLIGGTLFVWGQAYPPSNLDGSSLRSWLKTNWYNGKHSQLGYTNARRRMYNYIDNDNSRIEDVYSGYRRNWNYGGSGTNPDPINCEHTVPQSFFGSSEPMRSDIHHLFPVHKSVNSSRSSWPFGEINDNQTTRWWRNGSSQSSKPSSSIDEYSEYTFGMFEPREEIKGNIARAVFYFFTMYPTQAGSISSVGDIQVLYQWHLQDPVDADEADRNDDIEFYQGNRNPYVDHPELVARAWGLASAGGASDLMISEYVEGSSNNKAIEIVNLTGSTVNLSGYRLKRQTNGSGSWSSGYALSGSLSNGATYVVANSSATSSLRNRADATTSNSALSFNGNDPVGLFYNNTLVDVVGYFNGGSSNFAANVTLRRKSSVTDPSTSYQPNEWTSYASNTFSDIGNYSSSKAAPSAVAIADHSARAYPNPFQDQLHIDFADAESTWIVELAELNGRILKRAEFSGTASLDLATTDLPAGIYLLQLRNGTEVQHLRLVK